MKFVDYFHIYFEEKPFLILIFAAVIKLHNIN